MSFNKDQLLKLIIRPVLNQLQLGGIAAENLLLGTCAQESQFGTYLAQISGPALGIYQMEPATFDDIYDNFLAYRIDLLTKVKSISLRNPGAIIYNLSYATALARIKYLRAPGELPDANDIPGLANYYKINYNTTDGAATVQQFIDNYHRYVL